MARPNKRVIVFLVLCGFGCLRVVDVALQSAQSAASRAAFDPAKPPSHTVNISSIKEKPPPAMNETLIANATIKSDGQNLTANTSNIEERPPLAVNETLPAKPSALVENKEPQAPQKVASYSAESPANNVNVSGLEEKLPPAVNETLQANATVKSDRNITASLSNIEEKAPSAGNETLLAKSSLKSHGPNLALNASIIEEKPPLLVNETILTAKASHKGSDLPVNMTSAEDHPAVNETLLATNASLKGHGSNLTADVSGIESKPPPPAVNETLQANASVKSDQNTTTSLSNIEEKAPSAGNETLLANASLKSRSPNLALNASIEEKPPLLVNKTILTAKASHKDSDLPVNMSSAEAHPAVNETLLATNASLKGHGSNLTADVSGIELKPPPVVNETLIARASLKSHGFGVDMLIQAKKLLKAAEEGQQELQISWSLGRKGWLYAQGVCPAEDLSCFFEKPPRMNVNGDNSSNPTNLSDALRKLLVPLPHIQKEVDHMPGLVPPLPQNETCGVIHVRHADTTLNFGFENRSQTPIVASIDLKLYLEAYRKLQMPDMQQKPQNVILLTDDQNVIDDLEQNHRQQEKELKFHYLKRKRFRGSEGGWENHFPSGSRTGELLTILKTRQVVEHCSVWVGTGSSFANTLHELMQPPPTIHLLNTRLPITNDTTASTLFHGVEEPPDYIDKKHFDVRFHPGKLANVTSKQALSHCQGDTAMLRRKLVSPNITHKSSNNHTATQQMCEKELREYCCLNLPLPFQCSRLYCMLRMDQKMTISAFVFMP